MSRAYRSLGSIACVVLLAGCAGREADRPLTASSESAPAQVAMHPEHLLHSVAALGVPGSRRSFQVGSGGQLWTGEIAMTFTLAAAAQPAASSPVWFERDGVPIAHWWVASGPDTFTFEAAAALRDSADPASLELSVLARPTSGPSDESSACLTVRIGGEPRQPAFRAWDAGPPGAEAWQWVGREARRGDQVVARVSEGFVPVASPPSSGALVARTSPDAPSEGFTLLVPAYPSPQLSHEVRPHAETVRIARRGWRRLLAASAALETGVASWDEAARAALVTLLLCHERDRGEWVPIGNPFQYRDVWLRDGARHARALSLAGHSELARSDARSLLRFQRTSGVAISNRGQLDGTGELLWALEQVSARPPDRAFAREVLPAAERAREWIESQRAANRAEHGWPAGLLPFGNPGDNEWVTAPLVGNDAWTLAGLDALVRLAARAGDAAGSVGALALAADMRHDVEQALARFGTREIPASWWGIGHDWGNLSIGYPTLVLPPEDARLAALEARVSVRPGQLTLARYGQADSLHSYLAGDLAVGALFAGRPERTRGYLDDLLAHSSSTLGQSELSVRAGGFGINLPPHVTAAASVVDIVRHMLVAERGDTLLLGAGLSLAEWGRARLASAPTTRGLLDATFERPAPDRLVARWRGARAPVRIRVPLGATLVRAVPPAHARSDRELEVPPGRDHAEMVVRAEVVR